MTTERDRDDHGRFSVDEATLETRRTEVVKLRVAGHTFREIGAKLGIRQSTAYEDFKAVMDRTRAEADSTVEQERRVSLERIDIAIKRLMPMIDDEESSLDAMDRLDKLEKRRAALLGLDAPTKSEHSGPGGAPIEFNARSALVERLAGFVAGETSASEEDEGSREPHGG